MGEGKDGFHCEPIGRVGYVVKDVVVGGREGVVTVLTVWEERE